MDLITIWVAVVAGSFALIGALIGAFLTRSNEHRQWLRNEKAVAYREYLDRVALPSPQNFFEILGPSEQDEEPSPTRMLEFFASVHKAAMRVMLVAPGPIGDQVGLHLDRMTSVVGWHNDLPGNLRAKYYSGELSADEKKEADKHLRADAFDQLFGKLEDFVLESVEHTNIVANHMRQDLKVKDHMPWGRIAR